MQKVFVDANVLFSKTKRDWLYALYEAGPLFELYSSEDVVDETIAHIRDSKKGRLLSGKQIGAIRKQLLEIANMVSDYDCVSAQHDFKGSDPDDLHVHAAAVAGGCEYLLTDDRALYGNLEPRELEELPYEVTGCDDFFCLAAEASPVLLSDAIKIEMTYWSNKSDEPPTLDSMLSKAGCEKFACLVKRGMMRRAGMSPEEINKIEPLNECFSETLRERAESDLQQMSAG